MDDSHAPPIIPTTKFVPPRLRDHTVQRPHLIERVRQPGAQVVVVSGPAGYGKSVLLTQCYALEPSAVWLSLDASDNDPTMLWLSLIEGVDRVIPGFGTACGRDSAATGAVAIEHVVAVVINLLAQHDGPICLFLDDAHVVDNPDCRASIHQLALGLPEGVRLVLASRSSDPIPLAAIRARGGLVEVGSSSLVMSAVESEMLLGGLGVIASPDDIAVLTRHTEGWVAGLQLAGLALGERQGVQEFLASFDGSDRFIAEYLISEVLERLTDEDQRFLLRTSILTSLNGDLCDAVGGLASSARRLERLERDNAFVVPLDHTQQWYRYHHFFAELLSGLLQQRHPDQVAELHRRAFEWLRARRYVTDAIPHALAAGERHEAAVMVSAHWYDLVNSGRTDTLRRLLDLFDHDEIIGFQPLALSAAWVFGVSGDAARARRFMDAAARTDYDGAPPDGSASMASAVAMASSVFGWEGVGRALADAQLAHSLEPHGSRWRPMAAWLVADRHIWNDDWAAAKPYLQEVVESPPIHRGIRALAFSMLALWHLDRGDVEHAVLASDRAYEIIEATAIGELVTAPSVYSIRCRVALANGDSATAEASLSAAQDPISRIDRALPLGGIHARILVAEAALGMGDLSQAGLHLEAASVVANQIADTGGLAGHLRRLRTRLDEMIEAGKDVASFSDRELEVLELLPSELTVREIGTKLFLSKNTIKTHIRRIYDELDVSTRDDAVERARQVGALSQS